MGELGAVPIATSPCIPIGALIVGPFGGFKKAFACHPVTLIEATTSDPSTRLRRVLDYRLDVASKRFDAIGRTPPDQTGESG